VTFGNAIVEQSYRLAHDKQLKGIEFMHGEKVIVRAFGGEPLVRLTWEMYPAVVYICNDEGYQKLLASEEWMPVGFPREDVFHYDSELIGRLMEKWQDDPSIWQHLKPWQDEGTSTGQ
jgi:hypothetical protein